MCNWRQLCAKMAILKPFSVIKSFDQRINRSAVEELQKWQVHSELRGRSGSDRRRDCDRDSIQPSHGILMGKGPLLCTVTQIGDRGGIARVSILMWKALLELDPEACRRATLLPDDAMVPSPIHKLRFAGSVVSRQMRNQAAWVLFDHLSLASVQQLVWPPWRRPYGVFLHGIEAWNALTLGRKSAVKNATVRIANSRYTAQRITAAHPDIGPIEVCHLALPEAEPIAAADTLDLALLDQVGSKSVLIVGRMASAEAYKGHDQLLAAWPLVVQSTPGAQLVIVGRGDDAPRLRGLAKGDPRILFTGPVSEAWTLHALYERAAVFAMPSRGEGFGLVYLEAMQHRLPCIGSTDDAAGEVIADGETGFLVNRSDIPELAAVLVRCLEDSSLRKRMGEAGHTRLRTLFCYETFRDRLFAAIAPLRKQELT